MLLEIVSVLVKCESANILCEIKQLDRQRISLFLCQQRICKLEMSADYEVLLMDLVLLKFSVTVRVGVTYKKLKLIVTEGNSRNRVILTPASFVSLGLFVYNPCINCFSIRTIPS